MRSTVALVLAMLAAAAIPVLGAEWRTVVSPEGYQVQFPGQPTYRRSTEDTMVGQVVEHEHSLEGGQASYAVNCSIIPRTALLFTGRDGIYDRAVDALLKHNQASQTARNAATISNQLGLGVAYRTQSGGEGLARMLLVGNRLYVLDARWNGKKPATIDRFLASARVGDDAVSTR